MAFLYDKLLEEFGKTYLTQVELPSYIIDNLKYKIRPYQKEAFQRFILCETEDFDAKPAKPLHLLFNMATGSGKTLVMAGLILHLYQKGYRNFLFFVNSNNIIKKTKENFLNPHASKYLFADKIHIDGKEVQIKEVENFDEADDKHINIKFVSIQMLTSGLFTNVKENGMRFDDFAGTKTVLIGDEAHHNNAPVWGEIVEKIHRTNIDNILLEFTATLDYNSLKIVEKYQDKVLFKYDLAQFRLDGYSKEIHLVRSFYDEQERIIQALILNLYRQELAVSKGINLKPVILFKAKRTIKESRQNKENFHRLIDNFTAEHVEKIKKTSNISVVQKAFSFFEKNNISFSDIAMRIKANFRPENCISANDDKEAEKNQILLNTLEDENNPIRAVFAVQKLNEGWDVLNLFDIVRLYDGRAGRAGKTGNTTISEAQLIGRGARYFPFVSEAGQDPYVRKYDDDISNDLRILEELYYHTREDNRYISELKKALIDTGIYEDEDKFEIKQFQLKPAFKKTDFYQTGRVILNAKILRKLKAGLDVKIQKFTHTLASGTGFKSGVFKREEEKQEKENLQQEEVQISNIPPHIVRYALSQNPFFYFDNLRKYFPRIDSLSQFIKHQDYLGEISIIFKGTAGRLKSLSHQDFLQALQQVLKTIETGIKVHATQYEGSEWTVDFVHRVFVDKEIKVHKQSDRAEGQEKFVADKDWYVYQTLYGTNQEKKLVEIMAEQMDKLKKICENIYLIKNERQLKIYDKHGRAFVADFVLFCKQKAGKRLNYQVFIHNNTSSQEKWKENLLKEISYQPKIISIDSQNYRIAGLSFNPANAHEFIEKLENLINEFHS